MEKSHWYCCAFGGGTAIKLAKKLHERGVRITGTSADSTNICKNRDLFDASGVVDAKMRIFNLDGSEAGMCGNAIRCIPKYLYDKGIVQKQRMRIETLSGVRELYLSTRNGLVSSVKVDMGRAELKPGKIPVRHEGENVIARPVTIDGE